MEDDRITLTVPAKGEYAKAVRMTAAALVSRMGMSYDDVDDVRISAEEAFVYACDSEPGSGDVTMHFTVQRDLIRIDVPLGGGGHAIDEEAERRASYATFILQSVCDRFEFSSDENGTWLRLEKRVSAESIDDR